MFSNRKADNFSQIYQLSEDIPWNILYVTVNDNKRIMQEAATHGSVEGSLSATSFQI